MSETRTESAPAGADWMGRLADWIKAHDRGILIAAAVFHVLVLVGMIAWRAVPHLSGQTVRLRVVPVDPRDLFRGDYVILHYEFSQPPPGGIEGLPEGKRRSLSEWQGQTVYVTLVRGPGPHWEADRVTVIRPEGGVYLEGMISKTGQLEFGIESYFVQEGKGKKYEEAIRDRRLSAEITVSPLGQAALLRLIIE